MSSRRVFVITGLSGSGKSTAARSLEDQGCFVVDNLPIALLPDFLELSGQTLRDGTDVAVVIDVRNRGFLAAYEPTLARVRESGYRVEILFFEASDEVLLRRYSETRRTHPLAGDEGVLAGIERERELLQPVRSAATRVIDSGGLNTHQLRDRVLAAIGGETAGAALIVQLESFGYRYGLPPDADLVFDVRFLPNPHYIDELRPLTGLDQGLRQYVLSQPPCQEFLDHLSRLFTFLLPHYRAEGKSYLTIAIGCTGGRHRSVSLVETLSQNWPAAQVNLRINHRDINKG